MGNAVPSPEKKGSIFIFYGYKNSVNLKKKKLLGLKPKKVYGINHTLPFYSHDFFFNAIDNRKKN
jgi:hypothetical protein